MEAGEVIKKLRIKKKLTQDELGVLLGVKKSAVQKYESGAIANFKIETLQKLSIIFNAQPWIFIFPESITNENFDMVVDTYTNEHFTTMYDQYMTLNDKGKQKVSAYIEDLYYNPDNLQKVKIKSK